MQNLADFEHHSKWDDHLQCSHWSRYTNSNFILKKKEIENFKGIFICRQQQSAMQLHKSQFEKAIGCNKKCHWFADNHREGKGRSHCRVGQQSRATLNERIVCLSLCGSDWVDVFVVCIFCHLSTSDLCYFNDSDFWFVAFCHKFMCSFKYFIA